MRQKLIPIIAPVAPKCFMSRDQWVEYLKSAQAGDKGQRPFQGDQYRATFHFCKDCPASHRQAMDAAGRCDFEGYVIFVRRQQARPQQRERVDASAA